MIIPWQELGDDGVLLIPRVFQQLQQQLQQGSPVVMATVIQTQGSTPRQVGTRMLIHPDGTITGTIGGGAGEAKVIAQALSVFQTGRNQSVEIDLLGALGSKTSHEGICGGSMSIWLEIWQGGHALQRLQDLIDRLQQKQSADLVTPLQPHLQSYSLDSNGVPEKQIIPIEQVATLAFMDRIQVEPTLLIIGGGHVGLALAECAGRLDFQVVVQDDRSGSIPSISEPIHRSYQSLTHALANLRSREQLYVALVTRGYQQDLDALHVLLQFEPLPYYLGMMGSRRRIQTVLQQLRQESIPEVILQQIHAPIGLEIGAESPAEIAISICAELIRVRHHK